MSSIGATIDGRYQIQRLLGEGGMGAVFEATHLALGKSVALKIIHPELVHSAEARARFEREVKATAAIEHPHVVSGIDCGTLPDGGAFLVTQLVRGESLAASCMRTDTTWRDAVLIAAQIADGLAAIHAAGLVHRDLTPANVLISRGHDGSPHAYLLDLGIVGLREGMPGPKLTMDGTIVGTNGYMAPEQALGSESDPRADLYPLGVLLWEMLSARTLWAGEATDVVTSQVTQPPPDLPHDVAARVPPALIALVRALLQPERDDRPSSALEVHRALCDIATARSWSVLPVAREAMGWVVMRAHASPIRVGFTIGTIVVVSALAGALLFTLGSRLGSQTQPAPAQVASVYEPAESTTLPVALPPPGPEVETLLRGRFRAQRRGAARAVLEAGEPSWAVAVAELELARTCTARAEALERIVTANDPRAVPALRRWMAAPTSGCGRDRRFDCYGCIRDELARAVEGLTAAD